MPGVDAREPAPCSGGGNDDERRFETGGRNVPAAGGPADDGGAGAVLPGALRGAPGGPDRGGGGVAEGLAASVAPAFLLTHFPRSVS